VLRRAVLRGAVLRRAVLRGAVLEALAPDAPMAAMAMPAAAAAHARVLKLLALPCRRLANRRGTGQVMPIPTQIAVIFRTIAITLTGDPFPIRPGSSAVDPA